MSACCAKNNAVEVKSVTCPNCSKKCAAVPYQTVLLHIVKPWLASIKEQRYYFCRSHDCSAVYVGADKVVIDKAMMRTTVGIKDASPESLACYCFGVTKADAVENPLTRAFVVEQTKKGMCICSTYNPSGKCCLKDFPVSPSSIH